MATEQTEQLTAQIGKLFSREEQKLIQIFKGQVEVTDGHDWLHEADHTSIRIRVTSRKQLHQNNRHAAKASVPRCKLC